MNSKVRRHPPRTKRDCPYRTVKQGLCALAYIEDEQQCDKITYCNRMAPYQRKSHKRNRTNENKTD
ncbi:MAG: hypothetical protein IJV22_04615 [Bacteroidales bacterium]|nr:hypothetical protein [Bacteroidales bacterium]